MPEPGASAAAAPASGGSIAAVMTGRRYLLTVTAGAWVEVVLLDADGKPVAGEPYALLLPGGERREGKLDAAGRARVTGLPRGECRVVFPERDATDLVPLRTDTFLEIALVDADGKPLAEEPYEVTLFDGSKRAGKLDARGRARLEGLSPDLCRVTFPRRPEGDIERA